MVTIPVLFIDDDPPSVAPLRRLLERMAEQQSSRFSLQMQETVTTDGAGRARLQALRDTLGERGRRVLVFVDLNLQSREQAGVAVIKHLHEEFPEAVCCIYAKEPETGTYQHEYQGAGAVMVIQKPLADGSGSAVADLAASREPLVQFVLDRHFLSCPVHGPACGLRRREQTYLVNRPFHRNVTIAHAMLEQRDVGGTPALPRRAISSDTLGHFQGNLRRITEAAAAAGLHPLLPGVESGARFLIDDFRARLHCSRRAIAVLDDPREPSGVNPSVLVELGVMEEWKGGSREHDFILVGESGPANGIATLAGLVIHSYADAETWLGQQ